MKLKKNMYIRTKCNDFCNEVAIRKIVMVDEDNNKVFWIDTFIRDVYDACQDKLQAEDVEKASFNIIDVLKVGDFLDNHCIIAIKNNTCYLNDGWFIDKDNINQLVTFICTKEEFEEVCYGLGELL